MSRPKTTLRSLFQKLKQCPEQSTGCTEALVRSTWHSLQRISLEHGDRLTPAILLALTLYDEDVGRLLTGEELNQLTTLGQKAMARYQQQLNPPNPVGKALAAALKENP